MVGTWSGAWESPEERKRSRRIERVVPIVVALAVGVGGWLVASNRSDDSHPSEWDPRVAELVSFVERERELDFLHPVQVDFLPEEGFRSTVEGDSADEVDAEAREEAEQDVRLMRALGLAEGEVDLFDASSRLATETILAYYDPDEARIVVRGQRLDVDTRVTLVHELVHALQDQHFGLARLDEIEDSSASFAAAALVEGDATVVEDAYVETLDDDERREYDEAIDDFGEDVDLEGVPEALSLYQAAPYVLGPALVDALLADGGHERLDAAFDDLPTTEEHLLAPLTFLDDERVVDVGAPAVLDGEEALTRDTFGAFGLFLVLSERIDAHEALRAADAWAGDRYVSYRADDRDCVRVGFAAQDAAGAGRLGAALESWVAEGPTGSADVERDGPTTVLDACDPGVDADVVTGASTDAFALPVARASFLRGFLAEDAPLDAAWCTAARVVEHSTLDELNDETGESFASPEFQARLVAEITACVEP